MSEADNRIKRWDVACLIGGDDTAAAIAADLRLRRYETDGVVKPVIRPEQSEIRLPPWLSASLKATSRTRREALDAFYEGRKSEGLPALHPTPEPAISNESYYGTDDLLAVAPLERPLAPLPEKFCQLAFGTKEDPDALPVVTSTTTPAQDGKTAPTFLRKSKVIELLQPYCPQIQSILENASASQSDWVRSAQAPQGRRGWDFWVLVELLSDRLLLRKDAVEAIREKTAEGRGVWAGLFAAQ